MPCNSKRLSLHTSHFIDYVQAQVNDPASARIGREVNNAHQKKVTEIINAHASVPASKVIPFAFSASGHIHPATLLFIDRFLCIAASSPLSAAPSNEKLKFWHAVSGAVVDKTAYLHASHFQRFVNTYHSALFPHTIQQFHPDYATPNRRFRRSRPAPVPADASVSDAASSQSSAPALPLPLHSSSVSNAASSLLPPLTPHAPSAPRAGGGRAGLRPRGVPRDYVGMSQNGLI